MNPKSLLIFLCLSIQVVYSKEIPLRHQGPTPPFGELTNLKDHVLTVFATSPEVNSPVSIVAEPGGALLVLCDNNAGLGLLPNQGSILRLVDKDGDGRADTMTKFVENIDTPRGGQFINGTLYLMHPPFVSTFRDLDHDGIADEHKILATGFSHDLSYNRGADHSSNDLKIGIDGWIYTAIGDFGAKAEGSDGSKVELYGGGVIRMRLDGSDLQIYARGTRNTYDLAINHKLDIISLDNTNDGDGWNARLLHLTPLAHMGYPNLYKNFTEDAMPPLFDFGGGSGVGSLFINEPGFPEWINKRFNTISLGKMYTHHFKPYEATFTQESYDTFEFQKLLEIDVDGSSRLYFSTFENGSARVKPGTTVGRVLQAKPKNWQYKAFPDLKQYKTDQLISALDQNSNTLRQNVQFELLNRPDHNIDSKLKDLLNRDSASIEARITSLFTLQLRKGKDYQKKLLNALHNDQLKEYAMRALADEEGQPHPDFIKVIESCLQDSPPRVQLQAIAATAKLNLTHLTPDLVKLSDHIKAFTPLQIQKAHKHSTIPHTAQRALIKMAPIQELTHALEQSDSQRIVLNIVNKIHHPEIVNSIINRMQKENGFELKFPYLKTLMRLYHRETPWNGTDWWSTKPNTSGPYYKATIWSESNLIAEVLQQESATLSEEQQSQLLFEIRRHNLPLESLNLNIKIDPVEQLVDQSAHSLSQLPELILAVQNSKYSDEFRIKAFHAALNIKDFLYKDWCMPILLCLEQLPVESTIYTTLKKDFILSSAHRIDFFSRIPKTSPQAFKLPPHIRNIFFDIIINLVDSPLTTEANKKTLISGMQKHMHPDFIKRIVFQQSKGFNAFLNRCTKSGNDKVVKAAREALEKLKKLEKSNSTQLVKDLNTSNLNRALSKLQGNLEQGKHLFTRQSCSVCHAVLPSAPQKGPYLGTVGNLFNREQIIKHIVEPNAEVAQGFQSYNFILNNGTAISGFITKRDHKIIEVRNMFGTSQTIQVKDLKEEQVAENSMMPPGLVNNLTLNEFASLVDYLQSLH